jgi:hypothetical protein
MLPLTPAAQAVAAVLLVLALLVDLAGRCE